MGVGSMTYLASIVSTNGYIETVSTIHEFSDKFRGLLFLIDTEKTINKFPIHLEHFQNEFSLHNTHILRINYGG